MALKENFLLIFFGLCSLISIIHSHEPCFLRLNSADAPTFPPFFLSGDKKLLPVKENTIRINHDNEIIVTCQNNYLRNFDQASNITVKCQDDTLVKMPEKKDVKLKNLSCDLRVIEEVEHNVEKCNDEYKGIIYLYYDMEKQTYIKLAEVCFDYEQDVNKFVRTYTSSQNFPTSEMELNDKKLKSNTNLRHRIGLLYTYRADKVKDRLMKIIGDDFNENLHTVDTVKLLPKIIFNAQLADVEKFPTNNVALWKTVAEGNWKRIINDINNFVKDRKDTLELVFGTDGIVEYNSKIYLDELGGVPVPLYTWAVLHDKKTHKGVAIMMLNNPFTEPFAENVISGENMCKKVTWLRSLVKNNNYNRYVFGATFCCELSRFKAYSVDNKSWYTKDSILLETDDPVSNIPELFIFTEKSLNVKDEELEKEESNLRSHWDYCVVLLEIENK